MAKVLKTERSSVAVSLAVAILVFPAVCVATGYVIGPLTVAVLQIIASCAPAPFAVPDEFGIAIVGIVVGLPVLVASVGSWLVYGWVRWERVPDPENRSCRNCGYDLTGNVSGRCPECGTVIPGSGSTDSP